MEVDPPEVAEADVPAALLLVAAADGTGPPDEVL